MGLLAVKHLDPVVGVDVHSVLVAPSPTPVLLPHPHVGFMLDLREYVEAAKGVVGSIAMMIVQEKVTEYIDDHPDEVKKVDHLADSAMQQVNDLAGVMGGKLPDIKDNAIVAEGLKLNKERKALQSRISNDLGSNVGMGGSSGRPIFVNGLMRATAGTHAYHVPGLHFPLGESFAPPPAKDPEPSNDGESYMGSKTVLANNDPMSFMALQALSCWSIGMEPPPHNGAHTDRSYPSMPSSVMLPIPAGRPVLVGGPPVMNMAATAKGLFKSFQGSDWAKALADKLHLKSGFLRCNVLKAEPVDATTGEVVVQQSDFTVSGRLPLVWERHYASHTPYDGAVGIGWQTPADIRLELMPHEGGSGAAAYLLDHATAFDALPAEDGWAARVYDWQYGYALYRQDDRLVLRTRDGIEYGFLLPPRWIQTVGALEDKARLTLPVERIADFNGNAWVFERDARRCIARIAEWTRDGRTARSVECRIRDVAHDGVSVAGWLMALTLIDADGRAFPLVSYESDRERNLCAAVDAMAHSRCFEYATGHRMVRHTSARGLSFYYSYLQHSDGAWRVNHAWGDNGLFDYRFIYDRTRMETSVINSLGHTTIIQMNERGLPVAEIDPSGRVTGYRYDAHGRASAVVDPAGRTTAWDYDVYGNLLAQTLPDGGAIRTDFGRHHHPVCVTLIGGRQWRYEWDTHGNLLAQISPSGAISNYTYDKYGQLVEHAGPRGEITRFDYDRNGNLSAQINALGHRTQYRYDARGYVIEAIDALEQRSHYEYDRSGNLTRAIVRGGREIHCMYDADGNLSRYRDPMGHVTQIDYTPLGQISRRLAPDGTAIEYRYNTEEQLIGVVNERNELYALDRDELGRIVVETDYWGQARHYRYGLADELLYSTNPLGQTIEYRYDQLGRVVQKRVPYPGHENDLRIDSFIYDRNGDLVCAQNPSRCVEFRYDEAGRVIEERQGDDFSIASDYDAAGNRTARRSRLIAGDKFIEHTVRYTYDALDTVSSIQIDDIAPVVLKRDALGRVRIEQIGTDLRRELSYEAGGQLVSHKTLLEGVGALFASEYVYDANGELVERRDSRGVIERFQYDPVGQIVAHLNPTKQLRPYFYDPASDLLKTHIRERHASDATDSMKVGTWIREGKYKDDYHAYDRAGNLIHKRDAAQDLTLHWDAAGQLTETVVVRPAVAASGQASTRFHVQYEYDAFQRRVRKIVRAGPSRETGQGEVSYSSHFFWDGNTLLGEYSSCEGGSTDIAVSGESDGAHAEQPGRPNRDSRAGVSIFGSRRACEWVYYPETYQPLATAYADLTNDGVSGQTTEQLAASSEAIYFYQNDPNGAPVRMHDADGAVVWEARYSSTGDIERIGFCQVEQPIRLQGQYFDAESNLHYNRYRYTDPNTAHFISQDPIGLTGGSNLYKYAPNIFGWIDPLGLLPHTNLNLLSKLYLKPGHTFIQGPDNDPGLSDFITELENNDVDVLGHNLKISDGTRDVGEIDVLTSQAAVQFKNGTSSAASITGQIRNKTEPYTTLPVVGFVNGVNSCDPRLAAAATSTVQKSCRYGYLVTGSLSDVIALLKR
ncbi:RHS repeat-associated core domain-containing protein [Burkholderia sp. OK233]|nr:RHS repeat-associated core domain-containing protein [Burkholderia sp. OK233]